MNKKYLYTIIRKVEEDDYQAWSDFYHTPHYVYKTEELAQRTIEALYKNIIRNDGIDSYSPICTDDFLLTPEAMSFLQTNLSPEDYSLGSINPTTFYLESLEPLPDLSDEKILKLCNVIGFDIYELHWLEFIEE